MYNPVVNNPKSNTQSEEKRDAKRNHTESIVQFQDQRPEGIIQSKLQNVAHTSSSLNKDIVQYQNMANEHASRQQFPVQKKENNTGLPDGLKSGVENLSGHSLDDVKVHYNSDKPAQLQAHAYAQGTDIHVASGQEKHLPHEAWHVVQQKQGRVKPTTQLKGKIAINDDTALEKEADVMGEKSLQMVSTGETEVHEHAHSHVGQVAQLQVEEGAESEDGQSGEDDEELRQLLDALSVFSMSDVEGVDDEADESELTDTEEGPEIDDSEEEIQLVKNHAVIQAMRGPLKKNKKFYIRKLAKSYHLLMRVKGLMDTGYVRPTNKKDIKQLFHNFNQTLDCFKSLRSDKSQEISSERKQAIERVAFFNTKIYYKTIKQVGGPGKLSPEIRFFLGLNDSGVKQSVLVSWYNEIKSRNKPILELISKSNNPTKHPWFMMDYEDIIDSQSEEADQAIQESIEFLMGSSNNDVSYVCGNIFSYISSKYSLPLVSFINAQPDTFANKDVIRVNYQINPSYTKYVDPTKTGQGSEGIQILGDSTDKKVKTDIRFIPGSLKIGDETSQVGMQMEAIRLSQDSPIGSEAGKDSSQNDFMGNLKKTMGDKRTKYIKGHLLNDHLGGPARPYNLFPITDQANSDHLVFMEKYVKAEVEKGYVMYYKVNIANPSVTDRDSSKGGNHKRRYSVDADIQCESAKLDPSEKQIEKHQITVKSVWGGGEVLDSTGNRIRRKSDTSSTGNPLATHADYTRKLTSGKADEAVTNPGVKAPDSKIHLIHKKSGYNQDNIHKGKLSDSNLTSTVTGAIPFSISGDKDDISTALQPSVASAVGKHIAGLIWASSFIVSGKLKTGISELELKSIKGVGPASIKKLKDNFEIK